MILRSLWAAGGIVSLGLAVIGIPLPGLPTVPFLLLAAFCFAKSSDRLHRWLIEHPRLGRPILDWRERGAISPRAKRAATLAVAATFLISLALGVGWIVLLFQGVTLSAVLVFIWSRPSA